MGLIKFRGMIGGRIWVYGFYAFEGTTYYIFSVKDGRMVPFIIDRVTAGQFIGIEDDKGNQLYEDDIVLFNNGRRKMKMVIHKCEINPAFYLTEIDPKKPGISKAVEYDFVQCGLVSLELLGNKHDNPELLESGL